MRAILGFVVVVLPRAPLEDFPEKVGLIDDARSMEDINSDGVLDLVTFYDWNNTETLPRLTVRGIKNRASTIDLRIEGRDEANTTVALGGLERLTFGEEDEAIFEVPFNLLPGRRPPRVIAVVPEDGSSLCRANVLRISFSKQIDCTTLYGGLKLVGGRGPIEVHVSCREVGVPARTLAHISYFDGIEVPFPPGSYSLSVDHGVRDSSGRSLDQIGATDAPDPFVSGFSIPTGDAIDCSNQGPEDPTCSAFQCGAFFQAVPVASGCACVPNPSECKTGCGDSEWVCDPEIGSCSVDCSFNGACLDPTRRCETGAGRCS